MSQSQTLALISIAQSSGLDYDGAVALVQRLSPTLPRGDIEAGRVIANAANAWGHKD